ncbi:MAG: threonine synthase [bacterium]
MENKVQPYCQSCGRSFDILTYLRRCPVCGGLIFFRYPPGTTFHEGRSIWRFRELLPLPEGFDPVSLGEGGTSLIVSSIREDLFLKNEWLNPTGSVKDRAMSVGISMARAMGFKAVLNASMGSAGLATAAYAARAGMKCAILVPENAPFSRVAPMILYGAMVIPLKGTIQNALDFVEETCLKFKVFETTTHRPSNPYQNEGTKTIAYEILEQLGLAPDWIFVPRASGGTLAGIHRGFLELFKMGLADKIPKFVACELKALNTFEIALKEGAKTEAELREIAFEMDESIETIGVKLAHAYPVDGVEALQAIRDSEGTAVSLSDEELLEALKLLAKKDGIFVEPSSAAALAGFLRLRSEGLVKEGEKAVLILTGSGFRELQTITPDLSSVLRAYDTHQAASLLEEFLANG